MAAKSIKKIGVLGGGSQGKAIAFNFARKKYDTVIYDISKEQLAKIRDELGSNKKALFRDSVELTDNPNNLKDCDIIIENVTENIELKHSVFKEIDDISKEGAILASNSSSFPPTMISEVVTDKSKFINIHYLGVSWGYNVVEVAPSIHTSEDTISITMDLLSKGGFRPVLIKECPGFIFNRIKAAELSNILRAYENDLVSMENCLKYIIYPTRGHWNMAFIDFLGIEISNALIHFMNKKCGDRFYISKTLEEKVRKNELGIKTGKGFYDYSDGVNQQDLIKKPAVNEVSDIKNIYVDNLRINNTNLLLHLLKKGKQVYFPSRNDHYLGLLKEITPSLYEKIISKCHFKDEVQGQMDFELVIYSKIGSIDEIALNIDRLSAQLGHEVPVAVNTPIYKISEIASRTQHPDSLIYGINSHKTYLANTELVNSDGVDQQVYDQLKLLIIEVTSDCIEVKDEYTRPLMYLLLAKMFESVRVYTEGIAEKKVIEQLLDRDSIFKDIDYFGLENLLFVSEYLYSIYGEPFKAPELLYKMVQDGKTGVEAGRGFNKY